TGNRDCRRSSPVSPARHRHEDMRRLGLERVVGTDQFHHLSQRCIGRQQRHFLTGQQFEAEEFGLGEKAGFDISAHRGYSATPARGVAWHCNSAIISSVERTSANMISMTASVALCSSSVRQALASDTKNTL